MKNKTCGECKYYCNDAAFCSHRGVGWKKKTDMICKEFEPIPKPTNGDRIRQMSNKELVRFKGARHCTFCAYCDQKTDKCNRPIGGTCAEGILDWLNAPAESGGKDERVI